MGIAPPRAMAATEDLIDFDIIETQKENIQAIPSGRSAKALALTFSPSAVKSPSQSQDLNEGIRKKYETELLSIDDSDDPLDIYDRYVRWTLNAYPTAQSTAQSQLLPLLERATKAFLSSAHYKNDPRYLKLWLHYIRLFSDAPRETFAFLSRHNIGEKLALFYEEFAAWLEGAGRMSQAEEVYNLGIDRSARPAERLLRKYAEFQHRSESRPQNPAEPSSPALPTVRPALATKIDPFASAATPADPQARHQAQSTASSTSRKPKMQIFADSSEESRPASDDGPRGWENIGTIAERKKENTAAPTPWIDAKIEGGKMNTGIPKMAIYKDQFNPQTPLQQIDPIIASCDKQTVNPRTGKVECVFVNLEAIYPDSSDMSQEYCFEELRAAKRGWLQRDWGAQRTKAIQQVPCGAKAVISAQLSLEQPVSVSKQRMPYDNNENEENVPPNEDRKQAEIARKIWKEEKANRTRKIKVMEVRGETQTIQTNLISPRGPKIKRKKSAEATMTVHTKAATDEVYELFNQPLKSSMESEDSKSEDESDDEDDYTSGGDSTGTGRISGSTSEFGDETQGDMTEAGDEMQGDMTETRSVKHDETNTGTGWSEFTISKHVPRQGIDEADDMTDDNTITSTIGVVPNETDLRETVVSGGQQGEAVPSNTSAEQVVTPTSPTPAITNPQTRYVPVPPEDFEIPTKPYRDASQAALNRLPFMTPIVEKTESSLGTITAKQERDYYTLKTPCPKAGQKTPRIPELEDGLWSSPFQEVLSDSSKETKKESLPILTKPSKPAFSQVTKTGFKDTKEDLKKGPIINDSQCNPMDLEIQQTILRECHPPLASYEGYFEHKDFAFKRSNEIRKFCKSFSSSRGSKRASDKTLSNLSAAPNLRFSGTDCEYTIKRELGEGAFAPVYLAERIEDSVKDTNDVADDENALSVMRKGAFASVHRQCLEAIKSELDPPSAWEFYIMRTVKRRLGVSRAAESIIDVYEMHLFQDEGYLVEEYRDQGTLLDLVNAAREQASKEGNTTGATSGLDECAAMFFTVELLRTVESLHKHGVIHGDIKADNVLVRLPSASSSEPYAAAYQRSGANGWSARGISLIDFGRGIDMRAFPTNVGFVADWKTSTADCPEMREARPWTFQVDYYGLAGVAHTLLFGRYMETVADRGGGLGAGATQTYKLRVGLKRWWQTEIWTELFGLLLNPGRHVDREETGKLPCLRGLREVREKMEACLEENGERGVGLSGILGRLEHGVRERKR